jgi:hypothetical protein
MSAAAAAGPTSNLTVVTFKTIAVPNEAKSRKEGRPVFDDLDVCEIRFAANKMTAAVFPAHDPEPNATRERGEIVTYAMLYNEQFRKFKAQEAQDVAGTPLSELTFLTEAKRRELRALNIHTAEALAALDGPPLKQLGMGGREWKNQAQAYIDAAAGSADVTAMAAQIAELQRQLAEATAPAPAPAKGGRKAGKQAKAAEPVEADEGDDGEDDAEPDEDAEDDDVKPIDELTDAELKAYIKEATGEAVRGNVGRDTLIERATKIARGEADDEGKGA